MCKSSPGKSYTNILDTSSSPYWVDLKPQYLDPRYYIANHTVEAGAEISNFNSPIIRSNWALDGEPI